MMPFLSQFVHEPARSHLHVRALAAVSPDQLFDNFSNRDIALNHPQMAAPDLSKL